MFGGSGGRSSGGIGSAIKMRLLIALGIAAFAFISYYTKPGDLNEVTGEKERVAMADEAEEIQLGLQAKPEMVNMHGGPSRKVAAQQQVQQVGWRLLEGLDRQLAQYNQEHPGESRRNPYEQAFQFTLLSDPRTVNAFALPGGRSSSPRPSTLASKPKGNWLVSWATRSDTCSRDMATNRWPGRVCFRDSPGPSASWLARSRVPRWRR